MRYLSSVTALEETQLWIWPGRTWAYLKRESKEFSWSILTAIPRFIQTRRKTTLPNTPPTTSLRKRNSGHWAESSSQSMPEHTIPTRQCLTQQMLLETWLKPELKRRPLYLERTQWQPDEHRRELLRLKKPKEKKKMEQPEFQRPPLSLQRTQRQPDEHRQD